MQSLFAEVLIPNALNQSFTYLTLPHQEIGDIVLVEFGRKKFWSTILEINTQPRQANLDSSKIKTIIETHPHIKLSKSHLKFIQDIASFNLAPIGLVLKSMIGILNSNSTKKTPDIFEQKFSPQNFKLKTLLPEQQQIFQKICSETRTSPTFLLDGITGCGKTEIFFACIGEILTKNHQSQILILLPEIALTSQLLLRFEEQFGFKPALWHSKISNKTRREIFYGLNSGSIRVIVGARSALLLPFHNLQLIVIDEEHDASYKQEDVFNFHARDMAIVKSKIEEFPVILSTATPALETYNNAINGKYIRFSINRKFGSKNIINFVDLRHEKLENNNIISSNLRNALTKNIANNKQSLLFLNRRGYAPVTLCKKCGIKYDCPNCDFHLVLHKKNNSLICHHCGHYENLKFKCKNCGEENSLISVGTGVEKLHEEIKSLFPDARIALITSDNIKNFSDAEKIVNDISCGTIDIIIGTQMISKGYDFANLNLVGIVDADAMLYSSDLRSLERAFQTLTQVMGRAGRRDESGQIIIQTYNPNNILFKKISLENKNEFYDFELRNRESQNLPPFSQIVRFEISAIEENDAKNFAKNFIKLFPLNDKIEIFGPAPAPIQKLKNRHHFLVHLKADKKVNLQKLIFDVISRIEISHKYRLRVNINPY